MAVVFVQTLRGDAAVNTCDLVNAVGIPMTGGVVGYMIKSALEDNRKKEKTHDEGSHSEEAFEP